MTSKRQLVKRAAPKLKTRTKPALTLLQLADPYLLKPQADGEYSVADFRAELGCSEGKAHTIITKLIEDGKLELVGERRIRSGRGRGRCYRIVG